MDPNLPSELRQAITDCRERGLLVASKWSVAFPAILTPFASSSRPDLALPSCSCCSARSPGPPSASPPSRSQPAYPLLPASACSRRASRLRWAAARSRSRRRRRRGRLRSTRCLRRTFSRPTSTRAGRRCPRCPPRTSSRSRRTGRRTACWAASASPSRRRQRQTSTSRTRLSSRGPTLTRASSTGARGRCGAARAARRRSCACTRAIWCVAGRCA